ncbi:heme-binding protein 1-like [Myripristis murdjan]|uniref:Heme-binding protein 1-like n=1 Tax=Myripristis murdjan TaxID=586833 RepID=A0A667X756_9TELE|nr:heme-binding protein 1-like [Myripristis murdjan]
MDGGGCSMNGGGDSSRGGESGSRLGLITLEDLDSLTDEDMDREQPAVGAADPGGDTEAVEEESQERLLAFWQNIGRGHRIDIPEDMAQPIQQLTTDIESSPNKEMVPFSLITREEKCGSVMYEKRVYKKACWACITVREDTYEQSICMGFMKIMRYICQQNTSGSYLGMTIPIVTVVRTDDARFSLSRDVTVAYYLPSHLQDQPPLPTDPDVTMEMWPTTVVYSRTFTGPTNETTILSEIRALAELLDSPDLCVSDSFIIAGYTSVAAAHRHNEVWFLERQ